VIDSFIIVCGRVQISNQLPLRAEEIIEVGEYHTLTGRGFISTGKNETSGHPAESLGLAISLFLEDFHRYIHACEFKAEEVE
jgi:hypothetical protein